ncbi:MAG TPA: murein biosynthesis integral membrane protein MurJ [Anaerolineales bacterium]|nr:murein biosynthesis integral membrane protein MurJ [Anaerolineales bacterium]
MSTSNANRQIARAAGTVMVALLFGQLAGLARGILVARAFGASPELDAFFAANRVSETLFLLVAGGALGSAFIPAFTGLLARDERDSAWRLASALANTVTLTLSLLAVLLAVFAPQLVRYALAPGFSERPELFTLTVTLLRIQLVSAVLFGVGGLIVGILNAHQIFLIPALTPAMYQLGIIFGAVVLAPSMGVYGLAWGVVAGAVLYLLVQIPSLTKLIYPLRPADTSPKSTIKNQNAYAYSRSWPWGRLGGGLGFQDSNVRQVLLLMGPRLIGVAVVQLNFWVNTNLASRMQEGSVASLTYGFSLMLMAQAAIAQSVAIAAMPTFSAQHALGKIDEMRASLAASLRGVILLALPASVGLILLREPLISLLYQRGEFDERDVQLVAWALLWYALGLVGHSVMEVLTRAFYAQQDTRTPVLIGAIAMGLNVVFSFTFAGLFRQMGWMPHGGLALANSLATALEAAALFIFMRRRMHRIEGGYIARGFLVSALASLGMGIGLILWIKAAGGMNRWLLALGGVAIGALLYLAGVVILRVPEIQTLARALKTRVGRSG